MPSRAFISHILIRKSNLLQWQTRRYEIGFDFIDDRIKSNPVFLPQYLRIIVKNITKQKKKMKKSHQKAIKIKLNTLFNKNNLLND